jgi:hypothetical protein
MTMTINRPGQKNGAGDVDAMWLPQFAGEVLTAFDETNVFAERSLIRTITAGKSAQFPATWKATARYHTPGTLITGGSIANGERTLVVDDLLISDVSIASLDEAKAHYDFRAPYTKQLGAALARAWDRNLAQVGVLCARSAATITGANGGTVVNAGATAKTDMNLFVAGISAGVQAMDEKDVPEDQRAVFMRPAQFYALLRSSAGKDLITSDLNESNGSLASGKIFRIFGAEIVKTNNLPTTNLVGAAGVPTAYQGSFVNTAALVMHKDAIGTVKLLDLAVEAEWLMQYQTNLILAKYAVGHGILRPECAVEIAAV